MVKDLEYLRNHLRLDHFPAFVGISYAGAIALRYTERYPSYVQKLILLAPQVLDAPPTSYSRDWITKRKDDPTYAAAIAKLMAILSAPPATDEEFHEALQDITPYYVSDPAKASDILPSN